ncbi:hypothetical protein CWC26_16995 [Pseudoalteromonas sp. S4488]|uniref:hypothetical protein n=1 Tax=Pseudoalteromonas sp. S4488 TaxID=579558 RepID=UPI00110806F0|nr:hypothetical protein [Pseudoalteromonas sp. S4488]TMO35980.1 hypothetical protein CWC26_16995 [Pseudoalteromonas sp. S4488]
MEVEEYLRNKGMGYEHLTEGERKSISGFALIWTLFEAKLLDEDASAAKICEKSQEWVGGSGIDVTLIDDHLNYFKERYIENGEFGNRFNHLNLRKNDKEELVKEVLLGTENAQESKLACCLIIILRFRNNYFHGIKWAYQFQGQKENFERSCCLLTWCLDRYAD